MGPVAAVPCRKAVAGDGGVLRGDPEVVHLQREVEFPELEGG